MDLFRGQQLLKADGKKVKAETALNGKQFICVYFSAHWCPPCRGFTPKLKEFYEVSLLLCKVPSDGVG